MKSLTNSTDRRPTVGRLPLAKSPTGRGSVPRPKPMTRTVLPALLVALVAGGCGSSGSRPADQTSSAEAMGPLLGSADGRLVQVRDGDKLSTARGGRHATVPELLSLTYDPVEDRHYGLVQGEHDVSLVTFEGGKPDSLHTIGPVVVPGSPIRIAEAMAWDGAHGRLLVAASDRRHTPISRLLLAVDPATGEGHRLAIISGSEQNEADALEMVGGDLVMVDNVVGRGRLFRLDPETGVATPLGGSFEPMIEDLAWDPVSGQLFGISRQTAQILTLAPDHQAAARVMRVADATPAKGAPLSTRASASRRSDSPVKGWVAATEPIPERAKALFANDFEAGSASGWAKSVGAGPAPENETKQETAEATGEEVFTDDFETGSADAWAAVDGEETETDHDGDDHSHDQDEDEDEPPPHHRGD